MFVAWLITFSLFFICIYATFIITNGLKEKDQYDLANLPSQLKINAINDTKISKIG